jgi:hypothetical protein
LKVKIKLGPARRMYLERLLERGLAGCNIQEVAETVFNRGLQEIVPAEWMREVVDMAEQRRARKRKS